MQKSCGPDAIVGEKWDPAVIVDPGAAPSDGSL
eukprot:COSAG04_NODE_3253_length_3005_cov_3.655540_2_plen_33_part_00